MFFPAEYTRPSYFFFLLIFKLFSNSWYILKRKKKFTLHFVHLFFPSSSTSSLKMATYVNHPNITTKSCIQTNWCSILDCLDVDIKNHSWKDYFVLIRNPISSSHLTRWKGGEHYLISLLVIEKTCNDKYTLYIHLISRERYFLAVNVRSCHCQITWKFYFDFD